MPWGEFRGSEPQRPVPSGKQAGRRRQLDPSARDSGVPVCQRHRSSPLSAWGFRIHGNSPSGRGQAPVDTYPGVRDLERRRPPPCHIARHKLLWSSILFRFIGWEQAGSYPGGQPRWLGPRLRWCSGCFAHPHQPPNVQERSRPAGARNPQPSVESPRPNKTVGCPC